MRSRGRLPRMPGTAVGRHDGPARNCSNHGGRRADQRSVPRPQAIGLARRKLSGRQPTVYYFHQADDPYSHLAAQLLHPLLQRYYILIEPWLVPPPDDSAAPDRHRLEAYALRDAERLARRYRLQFPAGAKRPSPELRDAAHAAFAAALHSEDFPKWGPMV